MRMMRSILDRRRFLKTAGVITAGVVCLHRETNGQEADKQPVTIKNLRIAQGVSIEADNGTEGSFKGSGSQDLKTLQEHLAKIRELLVGRNPFDPMLEGELFWERIYPGKARLLAQGRDPLTGETIANKPRKDATPKLVGYSWPSVRCTLPCGICAASCSNSHPTGSLAKPTENKSPSIGDRARLTRFWTMPAKEHGRLTTRATATRNGISPKVPKTGS